MVEAQCLFEFYPCLGHQLLSLFQVTMVLWGQGTERVDAVERDALAIMTVHRNCQKGGET